HPATWCTSWYAILLSGRSGIRIPSSAPKSAENHRAFGTFAFLMCHPSLYNLLSRHGLFITFVLTFGFTHGILNISVKSVENTQEKVEKNQFIGRVKNGIKMKNLR
ncbi:MAG: hypothetical protein ACI39E_00750, partial [Acutalibacteraceae bacterium]